MSKEIKIVPPKGYEINKSESTFERIVFQEIKKENGILGGIYHRSV